MKIKLVAFDDGIVNVGFRRISSLVKEKYNHVTTYMYDVSGSSAQVKDIFQSDPTSKNNDVFINRKFIDEIIDADIIGFSGMSRFADYIKKTITMIRAENKKIVIVWGGIHATVSPEDAIKFADAVCIGEGEKSFLLFLEKYNNNESVDNCKGFWIKKSDHIIKNELFPLLQNQDLSSMPFQDYGFNIRYVTHDNITDMTKEIYISQQGSIYVTLWVLGCPFHCTYCANSKFIKNHKGYANIRYALPEFIIEELIYILKFHDYITYISFADDNILMLKKDTLEQFASLYKEKIGLTLFLPGLHPSTVDRDKIGILVNAGLKEVRMGIQSGSQRILSFYRRNTPVNQIMKAADILSSFVPQINPPFYDIILDNPIEDKKDKDETLSLLYNLKRPFMLYIYSLRTIHGTELHEFAQNHYNLTFLPIEYSYKVIIDKQMGFMVYLLAFYRPSRFMYNVFLKISKNSFLNKIVFPLIKILYLMKRGYYAVKISNLQPVAMISPKLAIFIYKFKKTAKISFKRLFLLWL